MRTEWRHAGALVKFKLEVGATDAELLAVAERSRAHSTADLMCANTLAGMHEWAFVGSGANYQRVGRADLAARLLDAVETISGRV